MDLGVNKFKYPTSLEKNKLFVSNLPFDLDSCGVEKLFKSVILKCNERVADMLIIF